MSATGDDLRNDRPRSGVKRLPSTVLRSALAWPRQNLFSSPLNAALTLGCIALVVLAVPPLIRFFLLDAVWSGTDREACVKPLASGACWPFVRAWFSYFVYGFYPPDQRWRVDIFLAALAFGIGWLAWLEAPRRGFGAVYFFVVLPLVSFVLLHGAAPIGLPVVPTALWGGILVTMVVATVGIVVSLPLGTLLALARRSEIPLVRWIAVAFVEFVRGVPLITVLFMASVMLPLFVPERYAPDKLIRALVGVALFASAYMAEVVRGGLAAIPAGQYRAARSLGLSYWGMMGLVILPQALRVTLPNIVSIFIGLFKDTTLVFVVGIFDFLGTVEAARGDPKWAAPTTTVTGYAFAAAFYFVCCYGMSRYGHGMERRLVGSQGAGRRPL